MSLQLSPKFPLNGQPSPVLATKMANRTTSAGSKAKNSMQDTLDDDEVQTPTWESGICGCWSLPTAHACDWGWACTGNLCPCYLFMLNREFMLEKAKGERWYLLSRKACDCPFRVHAVVHSCCCCICFPWVGARNRCLIRESHGIPGNYASDCVAHMCCVGQSLAQEMRQLQIKGYKSQGYKQGQTVPVPFWRKCLKYCWPLLRRELTLRQEAQNGNVEECRDLLGQGCRVNSQDVTQKTPLINAAYSGKTECCEFLLESRADIHHRDRTGSTALLKAVQQGHGQTMVKLWEKGAEVNIKDSYGKTPLDYAAGETELFLRSILGIKEEQVVTVQDLIQASLQR